MEFKSIKGEIKIPLNSNIPDVLMTGIEYKIQSIRLILDIAGNNSLNIDIPDDCFKLVNNEISIKDIYRILPLQSELLDNIAVIEILGSTGHTIKKIVYFKFLESNKEKVNEDNVLICIH